MKKTQVTPVNNLINTPDGNPERIEQLKEVIQRNYDNDNWYGYNSKRQLITIAAKVELLSYHINFTPVFNPAS